MIHKTKRLKFGDIVLNEWAGERNPHRISIFVRYCVRQGSPCIQCTDGKGDFWETFNNRESKIKKVLKGEG